MSKHRDKLRGEAVEAMMWSLVALLVWRQAWQALWVVSIVAGVRVALVIAVWYEGRLRRQIQSSRREQLGVNDFMDGGPSDQDLERGCDCQRPYDPEGRGMRAISMECPLHG